MAKRNIPAGRPAYTYLAKKKYWRFRYKDFEAPLPEEPGHPSFEEKYAEFLALTIKPAPVRVNPASGTFDYVLRKFYEDVEFRTLSARTQANYFQFGKLISQYLGDCMMSLTTVDMLAAMRNALSEGYANPVRGLLSRLYRFASDRGYVMDGFNPALRLRAVKGRGKGHEPWSHEEIDLMLRHATGSIRTLIIIALCTGQRPGDVERMTWSQVLGNFVRVRQRKTNELLTIPMHPALRAELDRLQAAGRPSGAIVRRKTGRPLGTQGFAYRLETLIKGIPDMPWRTPHGSRYATAAILRDAGCDVDEVCAIIGHRTYEMAMKYLRRRTLAVGAMAKMVEHGALPVAPATALLALPQPLVTTDPTSSQVWSTLTSACADGARQVFCRREDVSSAGRRAGGLLAV